MPSESILIVDDTPVNLKLTRLLLVSEGYDVRTAASAEEALEVLREYRPHVVLADIQLPGMDGLELTRRIKRNPATRDIRVIAVTAFAMAGDEQRAKEAGCDGYITKPIDTRLLGNKIREHLDQAPGAPPTPGARTAPEPLPVPAPEMRSLRRRFLEEGHSKLRQWLLHYDEELDLDAAAQSVHQWIGAGGLLGFPAISRLTREMEATLRERPVDSALLREQMGELFLLFSSPVETEAASVQEEILQVLTGRRIGLVGLPPGERQRCCAALELGKAIPVFLEPTESPTGDFVQGCDAVVVYAHRSTFSSEWFDPDAYGSNGRPILMLGAREDLMDLDMAVQSLASDLLLDAWEVEEALVRLSLALTRKGSARRPMRPYLADPAVCVVLAVEDPAGLEPMQAALQDFGFEWCAAPLSAAAVTELCRKGAKAVIIDCEPGTDRGIELLEAIRAQSLPVSILLLMDYQQDAAAFRGFQLGADDFAIKPLSPREVVLRLMRCLPA